MRSYRALICLACYVALPVGLAFAAEDKTTDSGKAEPQKVGEEAKLLLETKVTLKVTDMGIGLAWEWAKRLGGPLPVQVSRAANELKVTLEFEEASLAEVLRKITQQTGAAYRLKEGTVQIVTKEELAALEAGKATFAAWDAPGLPSGAASTDSSKADPQKVGEEAKLLLRKVSLDFIDTPLREGIEFIKVFAKVEVVVSQGSGDKAVTLRLNNVTLGEALGQIKSQAGAVHRLVDGKLLLALPEEWTALDAGKAKFEAYVERKDSGKPEPQIKVPMKPLPTSNPQTTVTTERKYVIEGKSFTAEELQKERPEVWQDLKDARTVHESETKVTTFNFSGKTYTEDQLRKECPDIYKQLQALGKVGATRVDTDVEAGKAK